MTSHRRYSHPKSQRSFAFRFVRMLLGIVHDEIDIVGIFNEPQLVTPQALTAYNVADAYAARSLFSGVVVRFARFSSSIFGLLRHFWHWVKFNSPFEQKTKQLFAFICWPTLEWFNWTLWTERSMFKVSTKTCVYRQNVCIVVKVTVRCTFLQHLNYRRKIEPTLACRVVICVIWFGENAI